MWLLHSGILARLKTIRTLIMAGNTNPRSGKIRIGTRGSRLALKQVDIVRHQLANICKLDPLHMDVVPIVTTGDVEQGRPLHEIGGKGLFCREIELQLLDHRIDIAVHSLKDMPAAQPDGLVIDCVLKRGDPRDALVSERHTRIEAIPPGTRVGTSSTRRRAQLLHLNPLLEIRALRGNVDTRLRKLSSGLVDVAVLAVEGLRRSGLQDSRATPVPESEMMPAPAQAAICIERRSDDDRIAELLSQIDDWNSRLVCSAERSFLRELGGDCTTPIGAIARLDGEELILDGELLDPDGNVRVRKQSVGSYRDPLAVAKRLAHQVREEFNRRSAS